MKPTDITDPEYFHKVVDCQYACPAHTPVPEYIRLIAAGRFNDAYMINWQSNVFPGVLGRTCDRPCEPACRRGRIEAEPVAICRLKRVAADNKTDIKDRLPDIPTNKNGRKIALIGAGPASLTVARDLMPLGYEVDLYDEQHKGGGFMRSQIPSFRLPESVLDEEVNYILDMGVTTHFKQNITSMKDMLAKNYDAIFVGTGAPRGRDLPKLPGRQDGDDNIHIGIDWLASVAFEHIKKVGKKVLVLGGGNTAMDCCRTAIRLGGEDVRVVVRSPKTDMKASPWEIEDAEHEDIPMYENHNPKAFVTEGGKLTGMLFEVVEPVFDDAGKRSLVPTGEEVLMPCDDVLMAIGQLNSFPWIERDIGIEFNDWDMPEVDKLTFQTSLPEVFVGGDAAWGPENVITAVAHGHQAAISIHQLCEGENTRERPAPDVNLVSQKMGFHDWLYDAHISDDDRNVVALVDKQRALANRKIEVEKGFDLSQGYEEAMRCLNCDVQTVFETDRCIECDACEDICPVSCINFIAPEDDEAVMRDKLKVKATNETQDLYVSAALKTKRVMVKDEDVCLHCGLCAERCPTGAWDMQKFLLHEATAGKS